MTAMPFGMTVTLASSPTMPRAISSAGMRVLLASYKLMQKREGTMRVENAQDSVLETLQMSGFASLFAMGD